MIHKLARRAEGRAVRDPVALVDGGPVHGFVETIKRPARRFFLVVHRSGPETPAPVDLAVVETIARQLFFRPCDDLEPARVWIESGNAFVRPGDKAAALSRDNGSDPKRRRPSAKFAGLIQPEDLPALDVDPIERLLPFDPNGSLAEHGADIGNALGGRIARHERFDRG